MLDKVIESDGNDKRDVTDRCLC